MSRFTTTFILILYFLLFPIWIINTTLSQVLIAYAVYWFLFDFIQSAYMHRWAAHNLWNPPKWVQYFGATIGILSLISSPIGWAAWHRTHHAHSDTEKDPHSPVYKSFWHIVINYKYHNFEPRRGIDRMRNKYFAFILKYETPIVIVGNLIIFAILPFQWFLTLWAIPVAFMVLNTNFLINFIQHKNGKPTDNPVFWPILFSEVYHGSHHNKPKMSYTKWDPAGWVITKLGWTHE